MPPNRSVKVTTPKGNDTEPMISGTGLGRAAADVEDQRIGNARMQERRTAGDHQPRFLGSRDDLELDADLVAHPIEEGSAIIGAAAGLGRDIAAGGDPALTDLAGAHPERLDRAGHRRFGQLAAGGQPLAEPHDAGERVDDAKAAARRAGDQQPAIVGAEIERGIIGLRLARGMRELALGQTRRGRMIGAQHRGAGAEAGRPERAETVLRVTDQRFIPRYDLPC